MMDKSTSGSAGIYIHFPFCRKKCSYCDFYSMMEIELLNDYFRALQNEIELRNSRIKTVDTIYVGGGTPTLGRPSSWLQVLDLLRENFVIDREAEITIEANPGTVTVKDLAELHIMGFNRLSIGVQSFRNEELRILGRIHDSSESVCTFDAARKAKFNNVSIDLIYALPGQDFRDWLFNLERALELEPDHISCYELTVVENTPVYHDIKQGKLPGIDEALKEKMFFDTDRLLTSSGYIHYEVSNYSKARNKISRHNRNCWNMKPYIGFGPSAHSFDGKRTRMWNIKSVAGYIGHLEKEHQPVEGSETISDEQAALELMMLGLRTETGINLSDLETVTGFKLSTEGWKLVQNLMEENKLICNDKYLKPAIQGMLNADGIAGLLSTLLTDK